MNFNSKKLAIVVATLALTAAALNSPAEARRYKNTVMRHTAMTSMSYHSGDHLNAHLAGMHEAPRLQPAYARAAYGRYAYRHAAPRMSRANRHVAVRHVAVRHVAARHTAIRYAAIRHAGTRHANRPVAVRRPYAAAQPATAMPSFGGGGLVAQARAYIGTNPTGMGALWCARFMNMVLEKSGRRGTGSNMANSFANYGSRVSGPQVGAIAVMSRGKRGGHVGIVSGIDKSGNPIVISGNYNRRVAETVISRSRIYAYVMP
jgi:uncharacterized protein (TIGR02594 family)